MSDDQLRHVLLSVELPDFLGGLDTIHPRHVDVHDYKLVGVIRSFLTKQKGLFTRHCLIAVHMVIQFQQVFEDHQVEHRVVN